MGAVNPSATRRVALCFDERGNPQFHSTLSPEDFCQRALCVAPPRHVIPIVFVPGIMGSNLRSLDKKDEQNVPAWRPPNGLWEKIREVCKRATQSPTERQLQLH
ncbi:MAG: hypothetical protein WHV61_10705, partial [Burkholderiales bacterium]